METKPRILYLQKILPERTDEENPLSTTQLINILNDEYGISAHRTTITKDIAALVEYGLDIFTIHSTQSKYFIASRRFELPELKLLIDAVESSKFITKKKSDALIEKIHTLTSRGQISKLKRNNYIADRIKPDNEQIYYIVDTINDAINAGKQISFQYYDYTGLKKKVLKNKGEVYKLSPYNLLWNGDYYYVIGYSKKKGKIVTFRVDRIAATPGILEKTSIPQPEDFNIADFTKEVFFMYDGDEVTVDLRCDNSLMKTMIDRFGEDVTTLAYDMTSFRLITEVSASQTFFGWVFGFGGKVQILAPESVKEQYRQMIQKEFDAINKEQE
ncbi:MAG: WYL domain-containing protein [Clostridiales bacterium]|nr:WYL domain-containing protein [Clostridiales bacterium]